LNPVNNRIPALINEVNRCFKEINEEFKALPRPIGDAPQSYLLQLCRDFFDDMNSCVKGENDKKDLSLMVSEADRRLIHSIKSSIAQFGLADHDENQRGVLQKSANAFLFEAKRT